MLYVSPPPCPFQSALGGVLFLAGSSSFVPSPVQPHRHSPPSSLPLHPGSLRLQFPNAFVGEAEIQFHNGQMIYNYLC